MVLGFRWRRDAWLLGSVVLAVLIVGTAAAYRSRGSGPVATPSVAPSAVAPLPEGVISRAELVYACVRGCRPTVRFADGREFEVPTDAPSVREITLSPDGRWLGYPLGTGFIVRDLLGTMEFRNGSDTLNRRVRARAWTSDSSQVLLAELRDGQPEGFVLLRVDGGATDVTAWPGHDIIGVRPPAELLTIRPDALSGTRVEVGLSNPAGTIDRWFTVDASGHLRPGERVEPTTLRFSGAGYDAVVVDADNGPVAVLRFAGAEGGVTRYDLADPGPGRWSVLGVGADGRAFVRNSSGRTEVWYLAADGTFRPAHDLPGDAVVITPGTADG